MKAEDPRDQWIEKMCEPHRRRLIAYARRWMESDEDAEDCVQEAFLRAYCFQDRFDPKYASALPWLQSIVKRLSQNMARSQSRLEGVALLDGPEGMEVPDTRALSVEDHVALKQCWQFVRNCLTDEKFYLCTVLYYRESLSDAEVGESLGISGASAKSFRHRGLKALYQSPKFLAWVEEILPDLGRLFVREASVRRKQQAGVP